MAEHNCEADLEQVCRHASRDVYIDTSKQPGDADHVVVFADQDAASAWFAKNNPEGVALSTG